MSLSVQISTLIASFLYGIFFSIMLDINYHFLYESKKGYKIAISFLFITLNVLLYFIILRKINYGIFHSYSMIAIVLGVLFHHFVISSLFKIFTNKIKTWYNHFR